MASQAALRLSRAQPQAHAPVDLARLAQGDRGAIEDALAALPVLANVPATTIRRLADRSVRRSVVAGEVIVEQGSPGDSFFLVADGRVAVIADEDRIREVQPPAGFGELALLHSTTRTATVRAETDGALLEFPRDAFVAALDPVTPRDVLIRS
jgi:CRP-like cAMP-binding protein